MQIFRKEGFEEEKAARLDKTQHSYDWCCDDKLLQHVRDAETNELFVIMLRTQDYVLFHLDLSILLHGMLSVPHGI